MATHHGKEGVVTAGGTGIGELTFHFRNNRRCCRRYKNNRCN